MTNEIFNDIETQLKKWHRGAITLHSIYVILVEPNQMVTAFVVGNAIAYLKEQYAVGTVEVMILRS